MITRKYRHALDVLAIYSLANIFFAIIFLPIWLFLTNGFSEFNPIYILGLNFESSALLKTLIGAPTATFYFIILILWAKSEVNKTSTFLKFLVFNIFFSLYYYFKHLRVRIH